MMLSNTEKREKEQRSPGWSWLILAGVMLTAVNLRAGITSVGPLIGSIREDIGISGTLAGMLTTLPLLAFAVLSPLTPGFARRVGMEKALMLSMIVLTAGIWIRSVSSPWTLMIGTALLGSAIAVGNVLLPSLVKRDFPRNIGLMTGTYSTVMNFMAAAASGVSIPLAVQAGLGWQGALAVWSVLSVPAVLIWVLQRKERKVQTAAVAAPAQWKGLIRSRVAWSITLFMGLQSFTFYSNVSWLPEILRSQGMDMASAGWMLSLLQFVSLPFSFIIPVLAGRRADQRMLVAVSAVSMLIGYIGLLSGYSALNVLWVILIGTSGGANFSLSLMFFTLRSRTVHESAALSGMAQSFGYLLAAVGPMLIGYMHDFTGGWKPSLLILASIVVLLWLFGMTAAKPGYASADDQQPA